MKNILLSFFLFLACLTHAEEEFFFSQIDTRNGLSDNRVRAIGQLNDGRMAVVTEGLINIYNGANFQYLHYDDSKACIIQNYGGFHQVYIDKENRLWMKNHGRLLGFDLTTEKFIENADSLFLSQGVSGKVTDFFVDSGFNFWYLTMSDKLYLRKNGEKEVQLFCETTSSPKGEKDQLYNVEVRDSMAFLFYKSGQVNCYDLTNFKLLYEENPFGDEKNQYTSNIRVFPFKNYLYQLRDGFRSGGIIHRFNIITHKWETLLQSTWLNTVTVDSEGYCWVSSAKGLWFTDITLKNSDFISKLQLVDGQVFETEISCQFSDNQGGFWLGTLNKGLLYYHPGRFKFRNIGRSFFDIKNESLTITCLAETEGKILAGTNSGVFVYRTNEIPIKKYEGIPPNVKCNNMLRDSKNRIWICTQIDGLFCIDDNKVKQFRFPFICQNLFETEGHDFYLATSRGFGRFSPETGEFSQIEVSSGLGIIFELLPFPGNKLLGVLYGDAGLFIYDIDKNSISTPDSIDYSFLRHSNKKYHDIFADHRGLIWFGTQDGLNIYNPKTGNSRRFFETDGLVNNNIRSIVEDNEGRIWLSTSSGVTCVSVEQGEPDFEYSFANFNQYDGIIKNEFLPRSVCLTSDNRLLWGGEDGFNIFDLNRIASSDQEPGLPLLTGLSISGNKVRVAEKYDGNLILKNSLSLTKEIRLKHFQNFVGFEFSALNYVNPSQTIYRYQLEGIDKNWNEIRSDNGIGRINYTNLPHGTYQLKVQAAINGNYWGEKYSTLTVIIRPPYWKTPLAYLLYGITILLILYSSAVFLNKRKKEKLEIKRAKDLEEIKLGFYTNVSHELRTPLTLIITPLESILRNQISEPLREQLSSIHRNAKNLLDLVNQLLDFRKIEMSYETIQLAYCQIDEFLENIVRSFSETAKEKNIHLNFIASEKNIYEKIDREKFRKMIYNLLSNALKFTPSGGRVTVTINKEASQSGLNPKIVIKVTDTGCGIPEKELPKIFDRFYQVNQDTPATGSGIGLHLVREYIQMHNGTVSVESRLNEGSTFILEIPCQAEALVKRASDEGIHANDAKILIVEDNIQFREFLCNEISKSYDVISATDGKDGLKKAREEQPSLVISDVMMPELSGIELCHQLKNDLEISHIPVILLSANSSDEYQNEGFKAKADAYIAKPFNLEILLLRIQNLIELQENRRSSFRKEIHVNPGEVTNSSIDEKLLKSVIDHINNNLENSSYSIDQLSREMFMDRTGLYRKIKAISGQTPSEFVRSIRLKKAAQLLENGMPVAEVCGKVGFATVSYFSKCFQAEFGCKPSHFKNRHP